MSAIGLPRRIKRRWDTREWRARQRRDDRATQALLDRILRPDSNCVDVGAHAGEFLEYFTKRSPRGSHAAIEPLPAFAAELRRRFRGVAIHECALAAEEGTASFFHAVEEPAWSGLHRQDYPSEVALEKIEVVLRPLDALVGDRDVDFVKIDVEGAELRVLGGMTNVLRAQRPIVLIEHAIIHAKEYGATPRDVHEVFDRHDYEIRGLDGHGPYDVESFERLCIASDASYYDRHAQTNWVARPR
jgi:FkbM family methyltransferase